VIKENKLQIWQVEQRQALPLDMKVDFTMSRIKAWYEQWEGEVYVSFSGGRDSTVLLDMVRKLYPEVPGVFVDTGLEYPEIRDFVKATPNVTWIKPDLDFYHVIKKYGYPVVSKEQAKYIREVQNGTTKYTEEKRRFGKNGTRSGMVSKKWQKLFDAPFKVSEKCCDVMKKRPLHRYWKETGRYPFIGTMAEESSLRKQSYMRYGCNIVDNKTPMSRPMMFWKQKDVLDYIAQYELPYSKIYDMGERRTGCMFCMFGAHIDKPNRFERMVTTHPKLWKYCMDTLGCRQVLEFCKIPTGDVIAEKVLPQEVAPESV
jgi:3'-phosphoadenosine 5'-phosphosulfate sulfotransferase (PAPS reductase)/FAD synthetase